MPVRDTIADSFAATDDLVLQQEEALRARTFELLFNPAERDEDIFLEALDAIGVDAEMYSQMTPEDLNEIDPRDRNLDWIAVSAAIAACAIQQARLELVYRPLLEEARGAAVRVVEANARLSNEQRKVAATEGVGKARFTAATEARIARRSKG